jgi:hypothetical protein
MNDEYFEARNKKLKEVVERRANEHQIGGQHYRDDPVFQHWDLIAMNGGRMYFVGQITKYIVRWREKNGVQDLRKSEHYLQKLIECHKEGVFLLPEKRDAVLLDRFVQTHADLHPTEWRILEILLTYTSIEELESARQVYNEMYGLPLK